MGDCIFCKIARGEIPAEKYGENDSAFLIRDRSPQAAVHVLAISKRHIPSLNTTSARLDVALTLELARQWAEANLPNGYRVVTNVGADAGQLVPHLHFHVLGGETLKGI